MKSIGILILGLLVGQVSAATVSYIPTGVYGVPGNPIAAGKPPRDGVAPSYDNDKRPLIGGPGQLARIGVCGTGSTEIVFTDRGCHTIRKLIAYPFIGAQPPEEQPHNITTLIGTGEPGDVDGPAKPVGIPGGGGGEDSGSESGSDCESGHRKHSIDGYASGEDSDCESGRKSHASASRKHRDRDAGSEHGSVHAEDLAKDLLDGCELGSPHRSRSPSIDHCDKDDSSKPELCSMGPAQFDRPLGIAPLPSDRGPQFLVSDKGNQALKVIVPFTCKDGTPNHLSQTFSRGDPENPCFITSDGVKKYFVAAGDSIVEVDFSQEPPTKKVIAGKVECEMDFATELSRVCKMDAEAELDRILSDDCGPDSGLDCEEQILVTPLNGACGIAYTTGESGNPTLHYTERGNGSVGRLVQTGGQWIHSPVLPAGTLTNPTSISATGNGNGHIVVAANGVNFVDATNGAVTLIVPAEQIPGAISAEVGCNGDIYVGCGVDPNPLPNVGGNCIRRFSPQPAPVPPVPGGGFSLTTPAADATIRKVASNGDEVGEQDFRFGLSSEQIMLTMRQRGVNFAENGSSDPYSKALNAVEKAVDSTQAIKQIGKGMTFWVSGLYTQGALDPMFGNPAMKQKHYGIMAGTHYKDAATQQIFGVAVNVGFGNSISKNDREARTDNKSAQITLYYNKKFDQHWKASWHNTLMRSMDRHQRPLPGNTGNRQIAIGNGVVYEFASIAEVSYKHEFCRDNFIKPFTAISYTYNKDMAWKEKNVGINNLSYSNASMDQIGLQFGIKASFGKKISDTKTFVILPRISYTNFAKMGKATQIITNEVSGEKNNGYTGTPGRHLISATLGIGVVDYESNTSTRFAYTGNVQKQKRSHEFLLDWGMKF